MSGQVTSMPSIGHQTQGGGSSTQLSRSPGASERPVSRPTAIDTSRLSHTYHPSGWFGHDTQEVSFDVSESDTHEMNGLATVTVRLRVASIPHLADRLI